MFASASAAAFRTWTDRSLVACFSSSMALPLRILPQRPDDLFPDVFLFVFQGLDQRLNRPHVPDSSEGPGGLLSDILVGIEKSPDQRLNRPGIADLSQGPGHFLSNILVVVLLQQIDQGLDGAGITHRAKGRGCLLTHIAVLVTRVP